MATLVSSSGGLDDLGNQIESSSNFNTLDEAIAQAKNDIITQDRIVVRVLDDDGNEVDPSAYS